MLIPRAYSDKIFSSHPSNRVWCLRTRRSVSSSTSPKSPRTVFVIAPFRELPLWIPSGSCFSYPKCAASSSCNARSTTALVICCNNVFTSSGERPFFTHSSTSSQTVCLAASSLPFSLVSRKMFIIQLHPRLETRVGYPCLRALLE